MVSREHTILQLDAMSAPARPVSDQGRMTETSPLGAPTVDAAVPPSGDDQFDDADPG